MSLNRLLMHLYTAVCAVMLGSIGLMSLSFFPA